MKKFKKYVSLFLSILMVGALFAGCAEGTVEVNDIKFENIEMTVGDTVDLAAVAVTKDGKEIADVDINYEVLSGEEFVELKDGKLTAKKAGTASVHADVVIHEDVDDIKASIEGKSATILVKEAKEEKAEAVGTNSESKVEDDSKTEDESETEKEDEDKDTESKKTSSDSKSGSSSKTVSDSKKTSSSSKSSSESKSSSDSKSTSDSKKSESSSSTATTQPVSHYSSWMPTPVALGGSDCYDGPIDEESGIRHYHGHNAGIDSGTCPVPGCGVVYYAHYHGNGNDEGTCPCYGCGIEYHVGDCRATPTAGPAAICSDCGLPESQCQCHALCATCGYPMSVCICE